MTEYKARAPRLINIGGKSCQIDARIKKGEGIEQRNKCFEFFCRELRRGTPIKKAEKRAWNQYRVTISADEEESNPLYKSCVEKKKLIVIVD